MAAMSTKSREVIWGGTIMGAEITARHAREEVQKAAREADRAEAYACLSGWKAMAARRSHPPRSASVFEAGSAGLKSSAIVAKPAQACRWTPSAGRAIRQSGN